MKYLIFTFVLLSASLSRAVVGGKAVNDIAIIKALGLSYSSYRNDLDTPAIPIGPRVAITCGHCVSGGNPMGTAGDVGAQIVYPPQMKKDTDETAEAYSRLPAGTYGLPFFEKANFSYDLALVILNKGEHYRRPYMSIGRKQVSLHEKLIFFGKGLNASITNQFCGGYISNSHWFAVAPFKVLDFYSQKVGFILTGKPAATCPYDSGGYYFRAEPDGTIKLVGINSWGTQNGTQLVSRFGAVRNLQGFLSGADDLTSPLIREWMSKVIAGKGAHVCGLNKVCGPIPSPFSNTVTDAKL